MRLEDYMDLMRKNAMNTELEKFFNEVGMVAKKIDQTIVLKMIETLAELRNLGGRVFVLGVGGSAGNASHMVNDLRKLCHVEAYAPTDNVSELTAWANDNGFDNIFSHWLEISRINSTDIVFVLSVGGGRSNVSTCLVNAIKFAKSAKAKVLGIVGKTDGYTYVNGDLVLHVPIEGGYVTPLSEAFQSVVWHSMVSHSLLQVRKTTW